MPFGYALFHMVSSRRSFFQKASRSIFSSLLVVILPRIFQCSGVDKTHGLVREQFSSSANLNAVVELNLAPNQQPTNLRSTNLLPQSNTIGLRIALRHLAVLSHPLRSRPFGDSTSSDLVFKSAKGKVQFLTTSSS